MSIVVTLVNQSTVVQDSEVVAVAAALNKQARGAFYQHWGILSSVNATKPAPAKAWKINILDNSDVQGALGYHDFDASIPESKVFAKTCKQYNIPWSTTASHELLEMLVDPEGVLAALDDTAGKFYSYEVCDPVEQDSYSIDGVLVSNYVYPSWFSSAGKAPYDKMGHLTKPFTIEPGGSYTETLDVSATAGWNQITARSRYKVSGAD